MMTSGLVQRRAWSVWSAMPWRGVCQRPNSLRDPHVGKGAGGQLSHSKPYTAGSSSFGYIQLRMLFKITESSCYLKHKNYSVSAAMTRAEGGSREKPQSITCVSLCLLAKGGSSCQHLGLEEVPTVLYLIHCFQFITTPISWFLLLSITKWKKLYPRFIETLLCW